MGLVMGRLEIAFQRFDKEMVVAGYDDGCMDFWIDGRN